MGLNNSSMGLWRTLAQDSVSMLPTEVLQEVRMLTGRSEAAASPPT